MRHDVHLAALRAAAKIALSATVVGCGASAPAGGTSGSTSSAVVGSDGQQAESFDCCEQKLQDAVASDDGGTAGLQTLGDELNACCQVMANHYDDEYNSDAGNPQAWSWGDDSNLKRACCSDIHWASATCTPWGPPVPPAMRKLRRTAAKQAMGVA
jgi:hypothetical protein